MSTATTVAAVLPSSSPIVGNGTVTPSTTAYSGSGPSAASSLDRSISLSHVDRTTSSTLDGDAESSKGPTAATDGPTDSSAFALDLAHYIFNAGFCHQQWADVQVLFFNSSLKLHRLVLARSPYLAHLMMNSMPGSTIQLAFQDGNITEEAVYIAIQHLYNPSHHLINASNARSVLATAFLFGGMPDLIHAAYNSCAESISASSVVDYVHWLGSGPATIPRDAFGYGVWADPTTALYGEWSARLRQNVLDYLLRTLPAQLAAASKIAGASSTTSFALHTDPRLMAIYIQLPHDLFKYCVESPELPIQFMQDRFSFAKRAIVQRKKLAAAAAAAAATTGMSGPGSIGAAQMEESVVLALKASGDGMDVHITRKPKRSRAALWKVEG